MDTRLETDRVTSSGARVIILGEVVIKAGDPGAVGARINAQRLWLEEYEGDHIVPVLASWENGYMMPRYTTYTRVDVKSATGAVIEALLGSVWCHTPRFMSDSPPTAKINECTMPDVARMLRDLAGDVFWEALPQCLTHGDPTFGNLLDNAGPVLIDPLPSSTLVPDYRAVDMGKMLQSILGWESIMYGWHVVGDRHMAIDRVRALCVNDNEWVAAVFFLLLHLSRAVPYAGKAPVRGVLEVARDALRL